MEKNNGSGDSPIPEFDKLEINEERLSTNSEDVNKQTLETLRTRLLSITIGVLVYLLTEERNKIQVYVKTAGELVDLIRIYLFVMYLLSLAPISQLLLDLVVVALKTIFASAGLGERGWGRGRLYKYLFGAVQGCFGLFGYLLAKFGSGMWKDLEEKSSCLVRRRGSTHDGPHCEYHILRITLGIEKKVSQLGCFACGQDYERRMSIYFELGDYCEYSSPICSKLVFLAPYMLIGGLLAVIAALVTMEYVGCYEGPDDALEEKRVGMSEKAEMREQKEDERDNNKVGGDCPK